MTPTITAAKTRPPNPERYEEFDDRTPPEREAATANVLKDMYPYRTPDLALVPCQQAICLRCDQTISQHMVESRRVPPRGDTMILAYCDHCNVLYQRRVRITAGVAIPLTDTKVVYDPVEKARFRARLRAALRRYAHIQAC